MSQQNYPVSVNARIEIRNCHNRVNVMGWDNSSVAADCTARQTGDTLLFENVDKLSLRVPRAATLLIVDCEADVRVVDLTGRVELNDIGGDVALHDLRGETVVGNIAGDLSLKNIAALQGAGVWKGDVALRDVRACVIDEIEGDASLRNLGTVKIRLIGGDVSVIGSDALTIDEVEGDVNLRQIAGPIHIEHIGDDLVASEIQHELSVDEVAGDAVLSFAQAAATKISAKGDVVIRLPKDANADIELDAPHGDLIARADVQASEQDESHLRGKLGSGGVKMQIESTHGDVILEGERPMRHEHRHAFEREWENFGHEFAGLGQDFARMGQEIAEEVHGSLRASLQDLPRHGRRHFVIKPHRHRDERADAAETPVETTPQPSPVDRQAILDAVARGELSVDDAIKKIRGEA